MHLASVNGRTATLARGNSLRAKVPAAGRGTRRVTSMKADMEAVGSTYASALVELAQDKNCLEAVHGDVSGLQQIMANDPTLSEFISNPVINVDKKVKVIDSIAAQAGFNTYTAQFLKLLLQKNRIDAVNEICEAFEVEYCKLTDTQVALVRSAVKLTEEQQQKVNAKLQELTGKKAVVMKSEVDPSLIGGFVVEYGSSRIDLSIKGELDNISNDLNALATVM